MDELLQFVVKNPILFLLLGIICAAIGWTEFKRFRRAFRDVSPAEAVQLINREDAVVLDVREPAEVSSNSGKIGGATHIPVSTLAARVDDLRKHSEQPIIAYCRAGTRSPSACELLTKNEFGKVYNLKGGLQAWTTANLPTSNK